MNRFWSPNLSRAGRTARAVSGAILLVGAAVAFAWNAWLGIVLLGSAAFVLFEAARGWCVLRACGIKTKL